MSWIDKLKTELVIICGDGKQYKPLWVTARKTTEYFVAEFNFPKIPGSLVRRGQPKGRRIPFELYFQGADHIEQAAAFEVSSADPRPWTIIHPYYGSLTVQPTDLEINNDDLNVSKLSGTCIETITEDYPKGYVDPADRINTLCTDCNDKQAEAFANRTTVTAGTKVAMTNYTNKVYKTSSGYVTPDLADSYYDAYQTTLANANKATLIPSLAIQSLQQLIATPARFKLNIRNRFDLLESQLVSASTMLISVTDTGVKNLYEAVGGFVLSAMCTAAATTDSTDYTRRSDAIDIMQRILTAQQSYLNMLDSVQSATATRVGSYLPDSNAMTALNVMISYTVSSLLQIALNGKQDRTYITPVDTNWIVLTHRFYGLDAADVNLQALRAQNGAGLSTALGIRAGTKIKYYI